MRTSGRKAPRFFLEHVFDELSTDASDRTLDISPTDQDGEVADVAAVLLLEVDVQALTCHQPPSERWPSPVPFAVHDAEQPFLKCLAMHPYHLAR